MFAIIAKGIDSLNGPEKHWTMSGLFDTVDEAREYASDAWLSGRRLLTELEWKVIEVGHEVT